METNNIVGQSSMGFGKEFEQKQYSLPPKPYTRRLTVSYLIT